MRTRGHDTSCPYIFILPGFRHFRIGWRQLAQLLHGRKERLATQSQFLFRGVAPETESQAARSFFRRRPMPSERVTVPPRRKNRRLRSSKRVLQVERNEERFAFDARKNKICCVWSARSGAAINTCLRTRASKSLFQSVAKVDARRASAASDYAQFPRPCQGL